MPRSERFLLERSSMRAQVLSVILGGALLSCGALAAGCAVQPGSETRLLGSNAAETFSATEGDPPSTGPLPAAATRDPSSDAGTNQGFSSPPSDSGGNPTPTPVVTPPSPVTTPTNPPSSDPYDAARAFCAQRINEYRATLGLPALARTQAAESCVDQQAQYDSSRGSAHGAFAACGEFAQNECPGWGGSLNAALPGCLDAMWAEGPGGGHYENMASSAYGYVACGIFQSANGWWIVQDFR
jgi:hypothetical protein